MFKSYLTVAIRNFYRNKIFVLINALGLGVAMACCIVAYLNYDFGVGFNRMHKNKDKIFKVGITKEVEGELIKHGMTPITLGPMIKAEMGEMVDKAIRYTAHTDAIRYGDKVLNKRIAFADPEFLETFTYPILSGNLESFKDPTHMLITQEMAIAYFGEEDPLGQRLTLITPEGTQFGFTIGAVLEDIPLTNSMQFDGIVLYQNLFDIGDYQELDWKTFQAATFLYLEDQAQLPRIEDMLQKFVAPQNASRPDWPVASYFITPLADMAREGQAIRAFWLWPAPNPAAVYAPPVMAILILLIACFNFTNTSITLAGRRLKEIGIRKVVGGTRKQLIIQFLIESALLSLLAILVSLALANYLVPGYASLWRELEIEMNLMSDMTLWAFIGIMFILTTGLSGSYPALYVSRLKPIGVLKGTLRYGGVNRLSKVLLTLQFGISLMSLLAGIGFIQNALYQKEKGLGYDQESVIGVPVRTFNQAEVFTNAIGSNSDIKIIGSTDDHIGRNNWSMVINGKDERESEVDVFDIGVNYLEAMSLPLNLGRSFNQDQEAIDRESSIIVNQLLVEEFGWDQPIGQTITYSDTVQKTIVGVVENFSTYGYFAPLKPSMFRLMPEDQTRMIVVKANWADLLSVNEFLEEQWLKVNPTAPYEGFYQEEQVGGSLEVNKNIVLIFGFLAVIALVMSSVGLFTLVSLSILRRIKELGVRKVLGASIANLAGIINRQFVVILTIASALGAIGGYYLTEILLTTIYADYVQMNWVSFAVPVVLMMTVAAITISGKVYKAATRNPVESLRYE